MGSSPTIQVRRCSLQLARERKIPELSLSSASSSSTSVDNTTTKDPMFDSHYPDTFVALKKDHNENDEEPTRSDTILFLRNQNNSCANWMDSDNYNQAIVTLGATVNLLNRTVATEEGVTTTRRNEDEMITVPGATHGSYSLDDCLDYSAAPNYPIQEFELRFHQRALRIPQKDVVPTTVLWAILTYNLALMNHHKAVQRAGPSRTQQTLAKLETSVLLIKRTVRLYQLLLPSDGAGSTISSTTSSNSGSQRFTRMVEQNITHMKTYLIQQKQERYETIMEEKKNADDRPTTSTTLSVTTDKTWETMTTWEVKYASMMLQQFIKKNESADRKMVVTSICSRQRHNGSDEDDDADTESVTSSSSLYEEHKALLRARYSSSMDPATTAPSSTVDDTTAHGGFQTKFHTAMCTASSFGHLQQQQQHPTPQSKNVQGAYAA